MPQRGEASGSLLQRLAAEMNRIADGRTSSLSGDLQNGEIGAISAAFLRVVEAGKLDRDRFVQKNQELEALNAQMKEAAEQVQSFAFRAGEANLAKREFLAVMSHEIRTPVNGIIGMTELALQTNPTPSQRDHLGMINSCAESLLVLLNDILDFSKIEAGKLELERTDFSIRDLLGEAIGTLAPRAHEKGIELLLHIRPEVPDLLIGDPHRLRQVVVNLVGNAIKFTEKGEVMLRIENSRWVEGEAELNIAVADTGIGIPADRVGSLFAAFSQADYSTTRRFGGTGLGLAISQQIVRLMKGEIAVESSVGEGSIFRFSPRFGYRKPEAGHDYTLERFAGKRVLLLDNHPQSQRIAAELLSTWRMSIATARDSDDALEMLHRSKREGQAFDLVIVDAAGPDAPGKKFAETVSALPELAGTRLLLLISAVQNGASDHAPPALVRGTLIKPVTARSLRIAVSKALESVEDGGGMTVQAESTVPSQRPLRVLVVEDNAVNQRLVKLNLVGWGHRVIVAGDGKEAVDAYRNGTFDLVFMDLQMPHLSGMEATVAIRKLERARGSEATPILALSANVLKGIRDECQKSGMNGYVSKPVRQRDLLEAMGRVIPNLFSDESESVTYFQRNASKVAQPVSASASVFTPSAANSVSGEPAAVAPDEVAALFDLDILMENIGGDRKLLPEVVRMSRDTDTPRLLKDLADGLAEGKCESVARAAHGLKGMVGAFNANRALQLAKELEESAREGKVDALLEQADSFVRALRALIVALEDLAEIEHEHITWI